jgi:hypothetical protein
MVKQSSIQWHRNSFEEMSSMAMAVMSANGEMKAKYENNIAGIIWPKCENKISMKIIIMKAYQYQRNISAIMAAKAAEMASGAKAWRQ